MNIGNVIVILFMVVGVFSVIGIIGTEVLDNPNLDYESVKLVSKLNYDINTTYAISNLEVQENEATNDSTFTGVDAYARQYLEDKTEIAQQKSILNKIITTPELVLNSFGIDNNLIVKSILSLFVTLTGIFIGLYIYKAVRTGEVTD